MARPIDADALIDNMVDYVVDGYAESPIDFESYTKMVQTAPTIDAVSVVRCKDCIHFDGFDCNRFGEPAECSNPYSDDGNDFCSFGERKESE